MIKVFHLFHIGYNVDLKAFNLDICTYDEIDMENQEAELVGFFAFEYSRDEGFYLHFMGLDLIGR